MDTNKVERWPLANNMLTYAAIQTAFTLICIYAVITAWKRGNRSFAALMLIPLERW